MADKRIAAHQHTLKIIENILTRKEQARNVAVSRGLDMIGSKEGKAWTVKEERQNQLRARKQLHEERERGAGERLEELAEQKQEKYNQIHEKRGNRQKTAQQLRTLVREMAVQQHREDGARRGEVLKRRQRLMRDADAAITRLTEKVADKFVDHYNLEQQQREPRVEVAPFQGKPARNLPRRVRSRPPSACTILHPAQPASERPASSSRPTYYSFRMVGF